MSTYPPEPWHLRGQLHGSLWIDDIEPPERHESRVWDCRLKRGPPKQPA